MTDLRQAFEDLSDLLGRYKALWTESAFVQNELSWQAEHPRLYRALLALSEGELLRLEEEDALHAALESHLPQLRFALAPSIARPTRPCWEAPEGVAFGVPGRKMAQLEGFVSALLEGRILTSRPCRVVDWCSGRGHLARAIRAAGAAQILCLERQLDLHQVNPREGLAFLAHDVLEPLEPGVLQQAHLHTALHACGDLHLSMLRQTAEVGVKAIACSPCCYHFTSEKFYRGLSQAAQRVKLSPSRDELRLATAETTTANALERKLRQRELLWRVAFDLQLRQLRGNDAYSRTPSVKKSLLKTDFNTFAQALLQVLETQGRRDFDYPPLSQTAERELMRRAQAKLATVLRLEKAQLVFRQALERWLLLDRALYLKERGYSVEIQKFCTKQHSARNHVVLAKYDTS